MSLPTFGRRALQTVVEMTLVPPVLVILAAYKLRDAAAEIGDVGLKPWLRQSYNKLARNGERAFRTIRIWNQV